MEDLLKTIVAKYNGAVRVELEAGHHLLNKNKGSVKFAKRDMFISNMLEELKFENALDKKANLEERALLIKMFYTIYNQYDGKPVGDELNALKGNPTKWDEFKDLLNKLVKFISRGKAGYRSTSKQNKVQFNNNQKSFANYVNNQKKASTGIENQTK